MRERLHPQSHMQESDQRSSLFGLHDQRGDKYSKCVRVYCPECERIWLFALVIFPSLVSQVIHDLIYLCLHPQQETIQVRCSHHYTSYLMTEICAPLLMSFPDLSSSSDALSIFARQAKVFSFTQAKSSMECIISQPRFFVGTLLRRHARRKVRPHLGATCHYDHLKVGA